MEKTKKVSAPAKKQKTVIDEAYKERFAKQYKVKNGRCQLDKVGEQDRDYLWFIFRNTLESIGEVPPGAIPNITSNFKYTPREMYDRICQYFIFVIERGHSWSLSALSQFIGHDKEVISDMIKNKDPRVAPYQYLKHFYRLIEIYYEYTLDHKRNPAGAIFALKNLGWKDKFEIEASAHQGALTEEERELAQKRIQSFTEKPL